MKKLLLLLMLLCVAFAAVAEDVYAPTMEEIWTEASLEEFVGHWEMTMVWSDQPVDLRSYRYLDIGEDGSCSVNYGGEDFHVGFDATIVQPENGVIYLADEAGEYGAYYFLFDVSLMGCVETLDHPGTISYLTGGREEAEEYAVWYAESAAEILENAEGAELASASQDFTGTWKCWAWTQDDGIAIMDPAVIKMAITFDGEQAEIASYMFGDADTIGAQVVVSDEEAMLLTEDDEWYYIFLRGEDELILMDDPEWPTKALFFYTEAIWDQKEAAEEFFTGVKLGEVAQLTSLEQVVGLWEATHYNMGGYLQPLNNRRMAAEILEDCTLLYYEDGEAEDAAWFVSIQDNYLVASQESYEGFYFLLYENDVLVQAVEGDDFGMSIYYQRSLGE